MLNRFLTLTTCVILLTGCNPPEDKAKRAAEEQAKRAAEQLGGKVRDDHDPAQPGVIVDLWGTGVTDEDLKQLAPQLAPLDSMRTLDLHGTKITDEGLKELVNLKRKQYRKGWSLEG